MFGFICSASTDIIKDDPTGLAKKTSLADTTFSLPISYLDKSEVHKLSHVVANDLELSIPGSEHSIYNHVFLPKHRFAKNMIPAWRETYTTNTEFLNDSQYLIQSMGKYNRLCVMDSDYSVDCDIFAEIWKDVKQNETFMEKYNFLDWDMLKYLNESSSFLQALSVVHIVSPVISLLLPFFVLILPFLILNIRGIPITFSDYVGVLKDIAKNHFIGKLLNAGPFSWEKVIYFLVTFALYLLQIYQNVNLCKKFYSNVVYINDHLCELKRYVNYSINSMETFMSVTKPLSTYSDFNLNLETQCNRLKNLSAEISGVYPFELTLNKFNEVGYMLKCYYSLHSNQDYEASLSYSVGFEGYVNNLLGVYENVCKGKLSIATFMGNDSSGNDVGFKNQYYPPLMNEDPIKNDCSLNKNIILSAPNKAGKTTILKTTTLNIIFSQQLGCGFYDSAVFTPYTHIHSYLNIPDTSERDSLFQAESRRCKEILDIIRDSGKQSKHFCIFDELYSGTNPDEASRAGFAFLDFLSTYNNVNFLLTTHYLSICKKFKRSDKIQNYKMDVRVLEDGSFDYRYKMKKGISKIKGAVRVLKDLNYPAEIISRIEA
jgi:hypothetical protein